MVKNLPANARDAGDVGLIPGLGSSPGGGDGNPLQYSCLEHSMDRDSSILAWNIPWTEEPGELLSIGSQRVGHD